MNRWVDLEASVHPVLKQNFWCVSVWFKCKRRIDHWSEHRIIPCWRSKALTLTFPNSRSPNEPMLGPSVHPTVYFENLRHRVHPTNVENKASVDPTLWLELQFIKFNRLWVFRRFFCFYFASMITLSWLTSKELESAYFLGFWCMVNLLVHEPLHIFMAFGAWSIY
jgi:hypothetical protein